MNNGKNIFNQFVTLNGDDFIEPFEIIEEYCSYATLFDAREDVFELFTIAMGSIDWREHSPRDKSNRMFRLKKLIKILETVYLIDELRKLEMLLYSIQTEKSLR